LTFTFTGTSVDLVYSQGVGSSTYGTMTVTIDGASVASVNTAGASTQYGKKQSYTGLSNSSHTMVITAPTDGKWCFVEGAVVYGGSTTGVRVHRLGSNGRNSFEFQQTNVMTPTIDGLPADLTFIALGTNDIGGGRTVDQYKTNLQTLITRALQFGSVVLLPMSWPDYTQDSRYTNYPAYVQVMYDLADTNNVGLIDIFRAFGSDPTKLGWSTAQLYGLYGVNGGSGQSGTDSTHPSKKGQQYIANVIADCLGL
jgi:lysophospholipase L1-like esterase